MTNEELLEKYPFLSPDPDCNHEIGEMDLYSAPGAYIPKGWNGIFMKCCEELREELVKIGKLNEFKITQLKEKYGAMCIYTIFSTPEVDSIIERYTIISQFTCCECGKIAEVETIGWVCPYCAECVKTAQDKFYPIGYVSTTKFAGGKKYKHYFCVDNLPFIGYEKNEYNIIAEDGVITIPSSLYKKFFNEDYLDHIKTETKTVSEISSMIEELEVKPHDNR